jgi:hypothetical protein
MIEYENEEGLKILEEIVESRAPEEFLDYLYTIASYEEPVVYGLNLSKAIKKQLQDHKLYDPCITYIPGNALNLIYYKRDIEHILCTSLSFELFKENGLIYQRICCKDTFDGRGLGLEIYKSKKEILVDIVGVKEEEFQEMVLSIEERLKKTK